MLEEFGGKIEAEVLDKCKVEENKREAYRGRGSPLEWRREKIAGQESLFREYTLQHRQSKQDESAEGEEMKLQQRMKIMKDVTKKIRSKGRMDAENRWWVTELLAADCEKAWIQSRMGRHHAEMV